MAEKITARKSMSGEWIIRKGWIILGYANGKTETAEAAIAKVLEKHRETGLTAIV